MEGVEPTEPELSVRDKRARVTSAYDSVVSNGRSGDRVLERALDDIVENNLKHLTPYYQDNAERIIRAIKQMSTASLQETENTAWNELMVLIDKLNPKEN